MGERVEKRFGEMTMGRYVIVLGVVLGIVGGLVMLLSGCDKELGAKELGELVEVRFSLNSGGFEEELKSGGAEKVNSGGPARVVEKTFIPAGDGMYFEASLRKEADGGLRAFAEPADGQLFWFGAFDELGVEVAAPVEYIYRTGDVFEPFVAGVSLKVPLGGTYVFVAYSYGIEDDEDSDGAPIFTEFPDKDDIDFSLDLVYGKSASITVDEQDEEVEINVSHTAPRVMVELSVALMAEKIVGIKNLYINGGKTSTLDIWTGDLSWNQSADVPVKVKEAEGAHNEVIYFSDYHVISPTVTSVSIEELEVELSGNIPHTFYGPVAKFNKELEAGYNYTLVVELKETRWAGSNIYYSDSHLSLRFDKAGSRINEAIQGVYFRWGSLVGIAPDEEYFSSNTALYYSTSNDGGYTGYESSWDDIPHIDVVGEDVYSNDREDRYLIDDLQNTPAMWSAWKGDICQYIGSYEPDLAGYRLPTSAEFGGVDEGNGAPEWDPDDPTTKSVNGWVRGPVAPDFWGYLGGFLHNGMTRLDDYYGAINLTANGYFPAAGRYGYITSYGTVRRYGVGNEGSYWSGSAGPKIDGGTKYLVYGLWFVPDGVNPFSAWDHFDAYPIRCIKRLPGELP